MSEPAEPPAPATAAPAAAAPAAPAPKLPLLRGERVWLRTAEKADFAGDAPVDDLETGHFLGIKTPISREGAEEFAQLVVSQQGKSMYSFSICLPGGREAIGNVSLRAVDRENGSAELAIVIGNKALQGQGYGTDALNCLVDFGFGELRLERIYLHVFDYNARAIRSYQKAGFQTDAVLRRARFHRGDYHDVHVMSILRGDWLAIPRRRAWDQP